MNFDIKEFFANCDIEASTILVRLNLNVEDYEILMARSSEIPASPKVEFEVWRASLEQRIIQKICHRGG